MNEYAEITARMRWTVVREDGCPLAYTEERSLANRVAIALGGSVVAGVLPQWHSIRSRDFIPHSYVKRGGAASRHLSRKRRRDQDD